MDTITHTFLGAAIGQALFGRRLGPWALVIGAAAGNLPDADVFIRTGDAILDRILHRHFTHSLIMTPVLGALAVACFAWAKTVRQHWKLALALGTLSTLAHILLDAATAYGTVLLWPFSLHRAAWDWIAVIDLLFTLPLIVGVIWALVARSPTAARAGLAVSALYMAFAIVQHDRALNAAREVAAQRGDLVERIRVMPLLTSTITYRSVYETHGTLQADAIRVVPFQQPQVRRGDAIPLAQPADSTDIARFTWFSEGYIAWVPGHTATLGDMRYSAQANAFVPLWGLEVGPPARWVGLRRAGKGVLQRLWEDTWGDEGFITIRAPQ